MPSIQIKDVPEETHKILRVRAAAAHQSLQEYLRSKLIDETSRPTVDEVFDAIDRETGGEASTFSIDAVVDGLRADREGR